MVGSTLADHGFKLVTGNAPGVDKAAADAFCSRVRRSGGPVEERYLQLALPYWRRGSFYPVRGFDAGTARMALRTTHEWIDEATARCAAVVMLGGHAGTIGSTVSGGGAIGIVNRFIEAGKPVFPIPFSGGGSDEVFQDILSRWKENPVPNLSRTQFLRLASPWTSGTGDFAELLLGCLAEQPDVFISYRRNDSAWLSWRLHRDLSEHFGVARVFMDLDDIAAGDTWKGRIESALAECRIGIVVIGDRWLEADSTGRRRVDDETDTVRMEVRTLLRSRKKLIVVTSGVPATYLETVPHDLRPLAGIQALAASHASWDAVLDQIVVTIKRTLAARP